jgi:hypothetical protein
MIMMKRKGDRKTGSAPVLVGTEAALRAEPLSKAEKLSRATDLALGIVKDILELGVDPSDVKLLAQVKDTALTIISQQIRVDEGGLRSPQSAVGSYDDMLGGLTASRPIEQILREVENKEGKSK